MAEEIKPGKGIHRVTGHAAVVRVTDGSERYLYRGATFNAEQADAERVKHLLEVGLIEKVAPPAPSAADKAAAAKAAADKAAAAKAEQEKAAAAKAEAEKQAAADKAAAAK